MGTSLTHNSDKELQMKYRTAVHDMGEALIYRSTLLDNIILT